MPPFDAQSVLDLEFDTPVRSSDVDDYEFGIPSKYKRQSDLLDSEAEIAEQNAMERLYGALKKQAYVSPEQGFATALLAAVPTLGGYLIGKSVGQPKLPPGYFEAGGTRAAIGLDKGGYGAEAGALAGLEGGMKAAGGYLAGLEADQAQANDIAVKMATLDSNKASRLRTKAEQYELAGLNKETELEMMPLREASQMRIQDNTSQNSLQRQLDFQRALKAEGLGTYGSRKDFSEELSDPLRKAAFDRISSGTGKPEDYNLLSPEALKEASSNARSGAYAKSVTNTQDRFETLQSYAESDQTVITSPLGKDPKLNAKRSEIISNKNVAMYAVRELAASYDKTSGAFFGGDRKKEAGLASLIFSVGRNIANTGAQFSQNEKPLVDALSAPQMDINGFTQWFHDYLMLGDPAETTRTIGSVLGKSYNERLKGYGQEFKEYASHGGGGSPGGRPTREDYKDAESYKAALKRYLGKE